MNLLVLFIPGLIAILGNIIFYIIVKKRIDKSIENYKISYSGIFKEKIEIHKEILKQLYELKFKVQLYKNYGNEGTGIEIFKDFNKFIRFYLINQPFLKTEILEGLKTFTNELQDCFGDFYKFNSMNEVTIDPDARNERFNKFLISSSKFEKDGPFDRLEKIIISEMKLDLKIENK